MDWIWIIGALILGCAIGWHAAFYIVITHGWRKQAELERRVEEQIAETEESIRAGARPTRERFRL